MTDSYTLPTKSERLRTEHRIYSGEIRVARENIISIFTPALKEAEKTKNSGNESFFLKKIKEEEFNIEMAESRYRRNIEDAAAYFALGNQEVFITEVLNDAERDAIDLNYLNTQPASNVVRLPLPPYPTDTPLDPRD